MAADLREVLGDMLAPVEYFEGQDILPSPNELRRKVLLQAYKYVNPQASTKHKERARTPRVSEKTSMARSTSLSTTTGAGGGGSDNEADEQEEMLTVRESQTLNPKRVHEQLSRLIHLDITARGSEMDPLEPSAAVMSNISEGMLSSFPERTVIDYNARHMTRVYPHGLRILSSNVNPITAFRSGCQIVAMNFQQGKNSDYVKLLFFYLHCTH